MERSLDGRTMKLVLRRLSKKELRGIISKSLDRPDILKSVLDTVDKKPSLKKVVFRGLSVGTSKSAVDHACSLFGEVEESNVHCEGGKCVGTATFKFVESAVKAILASGVWIGGAPVQIRGEDEQPPEGTTPHPVVVAAPDPTPSPSLDIVVYQPPLFSPVPERARRGLEDVCQDALEGYKVTMDGRAVTSSFARSGVSKDQIVDAVDRRARFQLDRFGIVFQPSDQELIHLFLRPRISGMCALPSFIHEVDIYGLHPTDLSRYTPIPSSSELTWFFYTSLYSKSDDKYDRTAIGGSWKINMEKEIVSSSDILSGFCCDTLGSRIIGFKRNLVFFKTKECDSSDKKRKAPEKVKTNWLMTEYVIGKRALKALCQVRVKED